MELVRAGQERRGLEGPEAHGADRLLLGAAPRRPRFRRRPDGVGRPFRLGSSATRRRRHGRRQHRACRRHRVVRLGEQGVERVVARAHELVVVGAHGAREEGETCPRLAAAGAVEGPACFISPLDSKMRPRGARDGPRRRGAPVARRPLCHVLGVARFTAERAPPVLHAQVPLERREAARVERVRAVEQHCRPVFKTGEGPQADRAARQEVAAGRRGGLERFPINFRRRGLFFLAHGGFEGLAARAGDLGGLGVDGGGPDPAGHHGVRVAAARHPQVQGADARRREPRADGRVARARRDGGVAAQPPSSRPVRGHGHDSGRDHASLSSRRLALRQRARGRPSLDP